MLLIDHKQLKFSLHSFISSLVFTISMHRSLITIVTKVGISNNQTIMTKLNTIYCIPDIDTYKAIINNLKTMLKVAVLRDSNIKFR